MALPADVVIKESSRIVISKSIEADVLSHSSHAFSPEDILVVNCSPQSVFRVRPATRCSSSLSGRVIIPFCHLARFHTFLMQVLVIHHLQVIHLQYSARRSPQRGISLPRAQEMPMHAYGICSRKRLLTRSPGTKIGFYASSGRLLNVNWRRGDTTAM